MLSKVGVAKINRVIELQKDFYKSELLKMGFFKTSTGLQLYELSLIELEGIYETEKSKRRMVKSV